MSATLGFWSEDPAGALARLGLGVTACVGAPGSRTPSTDGSAFTLEMLWAGGAGMTQ